jgi:hypothetical protein
MLAVRDEDFPNYEPLERVVPRGALAPIGPFKSKFGGKLVHEIVGDKPVRLWLLKGVFLEKTWFLIVGAPGCGKSFLTLDFCAARAWAAVDPKAPREWFGRKFKPGATVYIGAEGQEDMIIRVHAWFKARGVDPKTKIPLFLIPTAIDMRSGDAPTKDLISEIGQVSRICETDFGVPVDFVVVDTFNRALAGGSDVNPEHVGALIRNVSHIREECGVAVAAVHHTPRNGDTARGHGSVTADNDAEVFVQGAFDGAPNKWILRRSKAGPTGDVSEFRLRQIEVGRDEENDPITSCYIAEGAREKSLEEIEMTNAEMSARTGKPHMTPDGRMILGDNLTLVMRALDSLIKKKGDPMPSGVIVPHGRSAILLKDWTDEIVAIAPGDDKTDPKFKDRMRKARDAGATKLALRGIIHIQGDWVWRSSVRVARVDPREDETPQDAIVLPNATEVIPF